MANYPMDSMEGNCGRPLPDLEVGYAFILYQPYVGLVPLKEGFMRGSMFPNLYQPYQPKRHR